MRRLAVFVVVALTTLALPSLASAHPLGNFTVNRYAGIEIAGSEIYVRYALDLAEIPTYQLGATVRQPGYAARLSRQLVLSLDGRRVPLSVVEQRVTSRPGAGGLKTLRLDVVYRASSKGRELAFEDTAFPGRIGWREVTVSAREGARLVETSVPAVSESDVLRAYPKDLLRSPLEVSSATASFEPGDRAGAPPALAKAVVPEHTGGGFEALIEQGELSLGLLLLSFLIAAFWGAAHALTPGHGKALVAAYLVGTRGTPRHALMLGGTVTIAHTAGVFALGFVTLALSQFILPEQLYPWLTLVSGLLVVAVGAGVLRQRLRSRSAGKDHHHHHADHRHPHDHGHDEGHDHHHDDRLTSKGILGVGIAAGLLPCPSALVVLLSAIALHRVGLGLALIVAFSIGLAATITAIGLVAVLAQRTFGRLSLNGRVVRALPAVSAALILAVGVLITARAIPGVI
ncbi:MAG: sulfite exporter TauE/SafE family protein [Actinobacteria bacterium]|nr:sulfite exporter TauE/SafE family protein [Actinomycetota bacterium]